MNSNDEDIRLEELFRQKFEGVEVIPSSSANANIMRKLARREFVRFNPARFNIFYLGVVIVAGITASVLLFGVKDRDTVLQDIKSSVEIKAITSENNSTQKMPATVNESIVSVSRVSSSSVNKTAKIENVSPKDQNINKEQSNTILNNQSVSETIDAAKIVSNGISDKNELKAAKRNNEVIMDASTIEGCTPLKVHFSNKSIGYDSCRWSFGDGGYSVVSNPEWIFDIEGEYKVTLMVYFPDGTMLTSHVLINVHPKPSARFEIMPEKALLPENEISFYNYSANAIKYRWEFGDGNTSDMFEPRYKYSKYAKYNVELVVISDFGCSDSMLVKNAFSGSDYFIDFPNAFIPNPQGPTGGIYSTKSDESSQIFHPVFSGVTDYQLRVFSKLGILIFESSDVNIGWDGYFKGSLSDGGVYIWKVRGKFRNGEPFIKMGDVTLLKN